MVNYWLQEKEKRERERELDRIKTNDYPPFSSGAILSGASYGGYFSTPSISGYISVPTSSGLIFSGSGINWWVCS